MHKHMVLWRKEPGLIVEVKMKWKQMEETKIKLNSDLKKTPQLADWLCGWQKEWKQERCWHPTSLLLSKVTSTPSWSDTNRRRFLHALGEDRHLIVGVSHTDTNRGSPSSRRRPCVHCDNYKLVDVIGSLIVQATGRADHTPGCDVKIATRDEVGDLGVHPGIKVTSQNWWE